MVTAADVGSIRENGAKLPQGLNPMGKFSDFLFTLQ